MKPSLTMKHLELPQLTHNTIIQHPLMIKKDQSFLCCGFVKASVRGFCVLLILRPLVEFFFLHLLDLLSIKKTLFEVSDVHNNTLVSPI